MDEDRDMRALQAAQHLIDLRNQSAGRFAFAAYNVVVDKLQRFGNAQLTAKKINSMDITINMKNKLLVIIRMTPKKISLIQELTGVLGIGESCATALVEAGITDMKQLRLKKWQLMLPEGAKIILKYKPITRIPRDTIDKIAQRMPQTNSAVIAGSYRRGKLYSRDVDIMVVGDQKVLVKYVKALVKTFDGVVYLQGPDKASLLIKTTPKTMVKVDVFRAAPSERVAMLTYLTGPKSFNIRMRTKAKKMGYLLNQTGLFNRKTNMRIIVQSEQSLFKKLQMDWVDPENR